MSALDLTDTEVAVAKRQLLIGELADQGGSIRGISEATGLSEHIVRADMEAMGFPVEKAES